MNNLLSFCGLVDVRINASDKDLPVQTKESEKIMAVATTTSPTSPAAATAAVKSAVRNKPIYVPFTVQLLTAGTAACIADIMTFPLDTVKVRLQVQGEAGSKAVMYNGVFRTVFGIARDEGPK